MALFDTGDDTYRLEDTVERYGDGEFEVKDVALYTAAAALDMAVDGELSPDEFTEYLDQARDFVAAHYFGAEKPDEVEMPETEREVERFYQEDIRRQSWMDDFVENSRQPYGGLGFSPDVIPDTVVALGSGGIEPAAILAETQDLELAVVSYDEDRIKPENPGLRDRLLDSVEGEPVEALSAFGHDFKGENVWAVGDRLGTSSRERDAYREFFEDRTETWQLKSLG
ncbi:MAG: hypothetical protein ABEJ03_05460 [Candidatus Nanohaloarchaea archaeon]